MILKNTYHRIEKILVLILLLGIISISLSSCYNNSDLTEMAIATAIGFDKAPNGDIKMTVQLVKPAIIKAKNQGSDENTVWVYSTTGETVFSAIRNLLTTVNRKIFYSDLQLIVISEDMARDGIMDLLDVMERDEEIQKLAYMLVTREMTAEEVLKARSELENIPAMHLKAILDNDTALAKMKRVTLIDLLRDFNYAGNAATVGVVQPSREKCTNKIEDQQENSSSVKSLQQKDSGEETDFQQEDQLAIKDMKV